eukprot:jgi/Galph1/2739/GphlegSOOS_G1402.1
MEKQQVPNSLLPTSGNQFNKIGPNLLSSELVDMISEETKSVALLEALLSEQKFKECLSLLKHFHSCELSLPLRIVKSSVDAAIKAKDLTFLYQSLFWLMKIGVASHFASRELSLPNLENRQSDSSIIVSNNDRWLTVNTRFQLPKELDAMRVMTTPFPSGRIMSDTLVGLCFLGFFSVGLSMELVNPVVFHHSDLEPTVFLLLIFIGLTADRYMGSGKVYRSVERGLRRIFADDAVRASRCEAAFLLTGYLLGIPYLFFRPNARALVMHHQKLLKLMWNTQMEVDGCGNKTTCTKELEKELFYKYVVWMCSGLAAEYGIDGLFFEVNPDSIRKFVESFDHDTLEEFGCQENWKACKELLLDSAYHEAANLLDVFSKEHMILADKMLSGASAGECVSTLEQLWQS